MVLDENLFIEEKGKIGVQSGEKRGAYKKRTFSKIPFAERVADEIAKCNQRVIDKKGKKRFINLTAFADENVGNGYYFMTKSPKLKEKGKAVLDRMGVPYKEKGDIVSWVFNDEQTEIQTPQRGYSRAKEDDLEEALHNDEVGEFFKKADKAGIKTLGQLDRAMKEPEFYKKSSKDKKKTDIGGMRAYNKALGKDFQIKEDKEHKKGLSLLQARKQNKKLKEDLGDKYDTSFKLKGITYFISLYPKDTAGNYIAQWWDDSDNSLGYNNKGFVGEDKHILNRLLNTKGAVDPREYMYVNSSYDRPLPRYIRNVIISKVVKLKGLRENLKEDTFQTMDLATATEMTFDIKDDGTLTIYNEEGNVVKKSKTNPEYAKEVFKDLGMKQINVDVEEPIELEPFDESLKENINYSLLQLEKDIWDKIRELYHGFNDEEYNEFVKDYTFVEIEPWDDEIKVEVRMEASYRTMDELANMLNPLVQKLDKDAYFDHEDSGIINAFINKKLLKEDYEDIQQNIAEETVSENEQETGLAKIVSDLLHSELTAIQEYEDAIVNFETENASDLTDTFREIISDEQNHLGVLQKVLDEIKVNTIANIEKGQEEAEEILDNSSDIIDKE